MPCYTMPPESSEEEWLESMLCQAFKYLSEEQINTIKSLDCYISPLDFYAQHLLHDYNICSERKDYKKVELIQKEANRVGFILDHPDGFPGLSRIQCIPSVFIEK